MRDSVRAKMHLLIKRLLRKHKYPPESQDEAVNPVLQQAETLAGRLEQITAIIPFSPGFETSTWLVVALR